MPYININEYDYTITGPSSVGGNIVAIPINASDGPSDRWVTVHTYNDFVQLFGSDPTPNGDFGSSWQYAANLLLRNMSVCVRRITHTLDEDGVNKELLPGVSIAKAIIKLKDFQSDATGTENNLVETKIDTSNIQLINNTKLVLSEAGTLGPNPNYKQNTAIVEGSTKEITFKTPLALEAATTGNETAEMFADVVCTNSEWNYIGQRINPHYRSSVIKDGVYAVDSQTPMNWIIENNPEGSIGDFYVEEDGHVVAYSPIEIRNPNWLIDDSVIYPSQLLTVSEAKEGSFINVKYDSTNTNVVNHVWIYTGKSKKNLVSNHKYVVAPKSYATTDNNGIFESVATLNEFAKANTAKLTSGMFAQVANEPNLYTYDSKTKKFGTISVTVDALNTPGEYGKQVEVPYKDSGVVQNTGIYRQFYNWKDTGESGEVDSGWESAYSDPDYPELVFTKYIHWENSDRYIGTSSHEAVIGATKNLNRITLNTTSNLSNTFENLEMITKVNSTNQIGFQGKLFSDNEENRLTSGILGITNTNSVNSIHLYGFKITQKLDTTASGTKTIYDIGLENVTKTSDSITKDSLLTFKDADGNVKELPMPQKIDSLEDNKFFIEIPAGYSLYYNANMSNAVLSIEFTGSEEIGLSVHTFKSNEGEYELQFSSLSNSYVTCSKYTLSNDNVTEVVDYDNIPVHDGHGNINMFKVEYVYPGTNGNYINCKLQTIQNRGIYLMVYRNNQFLEQIELCNFRYRLNNNRVVTLDLELNKVEMWNALLANFGIRVDLATGAYDGLNSSIKPISGKYVNIYFNENIINEGISLNTLDYITLLYGQIKQGISNSNTFNLQTGKDADDEHVKHEIPYVYEPLKDKYRYNITFVSNGGYVDDIIYPDVITKYYNSVGSAYRLIEDAMLELAESRKDCVAFLDVPFDLPMENVPSYFSHLSTSYAAAYDPWGYTLLATGVTKWMPPSFVQLYTHAKSIMNGNRMYLPPAGVRRAQVTEVIKTNHELPSKYIEEWQSSDTPQFINPIIWINGYDYTIYGQKTLFSIVSSNEKYQSALQDLNVRLVANAVKKLIWATCINLSFELNTLMTWNEFRAKMEPELSTMMGEGILTDYEVIMDSTTMTQADLNSGHVCGTVRISVARAATDWDINLEITPNNVTFNEIDYGSTYSE